MPYDQARAKWIERQRQFFQGQLNLLTTGQKNPYDGSTEDLIFANTPQAKAALEAWINEIDTKLGF